MKRVLALCALAALLSQGANGWATGLATCDSGPEEKWQPRAKLEETLTAKGWKVRQIKVDGGCYEVYALDDKGARVEAYFDPRTLEPIPTEKSDKR